jgi:DNA gyrase subunit B
MADEKLPADSGEPSPKEASQDGSRAGKSEYGSDDLQHLSDLEHVRKRPAMYIGDTGERGLHHLVYEVMDNSIDEAMAGYAKNITVTVHGDNSVTVEDDGRGIPPDTHPGLSAEFDREISTLEGVMTVLKFGGKFGGGDADADGAKAYNASGGLHGVGVTVVNFLSKWANVEVCREGFRYRQDYENGAATGPVIKETATKKHGTKTTFKADDKIFAITKFDGETLQKRIQQLAFLNQGLRLKFVDERNNTSAEFYAERGLIEYVEYLNSTSDSLHPEVIHVKGSQTIDLRGNPEAIDYEIALQYTTEPTENQNSFVNNIHTIEGGTHVSGFRSALTRTLNTYGTKEKLFRDPNLKVTGDDFREGLTSIISVRVPEPQFGGQTKTKLGDGEIEGLISSVFGELFGQYLEENPKVAKVIIQRASQAAEAREAARKARDNIRRKSALIGGGLPGKLRDCISKEKEKCELYLVEGDSAGGSAEGGRDKNYQAVLPLRGKIINAYKAREDRVLANEEVQAMIGAIGAGVGADQDLSKRRYNKIIIMTDADIDGSHIRTLLLCFFYRQMYELVARGFVYVAQPPLFRVKYRKEVYYVQTEEEMRAQLLNRGLEDVSFDSGDGRIHEGEKVRQLCAVLTSMEEALLALERRGVGFRTHAERLDPVTNKLPVFHVFLGMDEKWFIEKRDLDQWLESQGITDENGDDEEATDDAENADSSTPSKPAPRIIELHEVRTINAGLKELGELGFSIASLLPEDRTGLEEPRYVLRRGDNETALEDLRGLLPAVRSAGQKGLQVTRFKGLGEMDAEELQETTLNRENRRLLQVTMRDAGAASEMFSVLMGEKVEPRREFIEKHALEVTNLDV